MWTEGPVPVLFFLCFKLGLWSLTHRILKIDVIEIHKNYEGIHGVDAHGVFPSVVESKIGFRK